MLFANFNLICVALWVQNRGNSVEKPKLLVLAS